MTNSDIRRVKIKTTIRDKRLDFIKGCLVVGMVLIHTASMPVRHGETSYSLFIFTLNFVSGSWIYITGLIIATHYSKQSIHNWGAVAQRLAIRGFKIFVIFISINFSLILLGWSDDSLDLSWGSLYVMLNPGTSAASFEILVGIGYMLLFSPLLLLHKTLGNILALLVLLSVPIFHYHNVQIEYNHWAIFCGMGGFLIGGVLGTDLFGRLYKNNNIRTLLFLASMVVVIIYFNLRPDYGIDTLFYLFGITGILAMLYFCSKWFIKLASLNYVLDLLGRYPLVGYLWQMVLVISLGVAKSRLGIELPYIIDLSIVMGVLILSTQLLNLMVSRSVQVNKIYKLIFG